MKKLSITTLFLASTLLFSCASNEESKVENKETKNIKEDSKSSELLISVDDLISRFNQKSDSIYVYNFWATWCKPCVKELPYFESLYAKYKSKKMKLVLVSLDFPEAIDSKVIPFLKKNKLNGEVLVMNGGSNPNDWIDKIEPEWSGSIPATLIIAPQQNHRKFYEQEFSQEELETELAPLFQ